MFIWGISSCRHTLLSRNLRWNENPGWNASEVAKRLHAAITQSQTYDAIRPRAAITQSNRCACNLSKFHIWVHVATTALWWVGLKVGQRSVGSRRAHVRDLKVSCIKGIKGKVNLGLRIS